MPLIVCADNHCNSGIYVLGVYVSGTDPLGRFLIKIDNPVTNTPHSLAHTPISPTFGSDFSPVRIMNISTLSSTFSFVTFPPNWSGTCAPIQLVMPFRLLCLLDFYPYLPLTPHIIPHLLFYFRHTRSLFHTPTDISLHGPGVYIDAIGVPRGVPDRFKARNQVAAGFESIIPQITINKNVDWINYNQQRFLNFTKDAIEGIHEQLDRTSLMTWQNRLALDMLLAEKGGVCAMFGDACCTYIPNNTAPDGSITRALAGLTALSKELSTNSGITNPWDQWFASSFGSWGQWIRSVFISLVVTFCLLLLVGCCIIPLFRYIISKYFTASMERAYVLHDERMSRIASSIFSPLSLSSTISK
ncbi:syncytin-2-like [Erpetoichthys calabaricus]|uniref:Uncharacterized protein n=1 Tax=Erpetoichthys calabaricus TaxID=27687 RepID=A0A8C4STT0_ERPCA|nr:syncytin-2-like [Erpetoichthys calabaricus]XP_051775278.1 syncytin-2-like [Erpetoichthys calabaricus]XP_051775279.1 syncytin-2-like [Erpetoichthys calabaricus]XP_051775329.1 syncytin-2-like [Erpetoichthys calabaricus]XP_051775330.1 syncytin-2-like [Erpetoichthys calabaricus]XP_051775331.1 syncytin-2-like [Erpetoichthys calabaricus]XP_051780421.1 syncytin-2-like [Erpetoichthys calabaricus]XP_051780422.1 syncytin-2-like [Erpetoichthys calabaricus]XP_051780423.1 syncytin-2-like [Erpetoichth